MNFPIGTLVQWHGANDPKKVYHGELLGYMGADLGMAVCTDMVTGLPPRPVSTSRLERYHGETRTHKGWAA